jgi:PGF-pre-PGF domain-containing protein
LPISNSTLNWTNGTSKLLQAIYSLTGSSVEKFNITLNYSGNRSGTFVFDNASMDPVIGTGNYQVKVNLTNTNYDQISGGNVSLYYMNNTFVSSSLTNSSGIVEFLDVAAEEYVVNITATNYSLENISFNLTSNRTYNFTLLYNDTIGPTVTAVSPIYDYNSLSPLVSFVWSVVDNFDENLTCHLVIKYPTYAIERNVTYYGNGTINTNSTINNLSDNSNNVATQWYLWDVTCYDDNGNSGSSDLYIKLNVDATAPIFTDVLLIPNPVQNYTFAYINFTVNETHLNDSTVNASVDGYEASYYDNYSGTYSFRFHINSSFFNTSNQSFHTITLSASENSPWNRSNTSNASTLLEHDFIVPGIIDYFPANGSVNFSLGGNISFNFSENVTVGNAYTVIPVGGSAISGELTYNNVTNVSVFDPYLLLEENTTYVVTVNPGVVDEAGNPLNDTYIWNFTTAYSDIDNDGIPDYNDTDDDGDGVNDSLDFIKGNESNVNTYLTDLNITVNGSDNISTFNGTTTVRFYNGSGLFVSFNYTFSNDSVLDFSNLTVQMNPNSSLAGVLVMGGLINVTKTFYLSNLSGHNGVCVRNIETKSFDQINDNCSSYSSEEYWIRCDNSTYYNFTCESDGTDMVVLNLTNSAVIQMNDRRPPRITSFTLNDGTYVGTPPPYRITSRSPAVQITTDENATCRYNVSFDDSSVLNVDFDDLNSYEYAFSGGVGQYGTTFNVVLDTLSTVSDAEPYWLVFRCMDPYGNKHDATCTDDCFRTFYVVTESSNGGNGNGNGDDDGGNQEASEETTIFSVRRIWSSINASEEKVVDVARDASAIKYMTFTLSEDVVNAELRLTGLVEAPAIISSLQNGSVYQIVRVRTVNFNDDNIASANIKFAVSKEWLATNNVNQDDMRFFRHDDFDWYDYQPEVIEVNETNVYYSVDVPGFSYFIIAQKYIPYVETNASNVTNATNESLVDITGGVVEDIDLNDTNVSDDVDESSPLKGFLSFFVVLVIVVGGLLGYYFYKTKFEAMEVKEDDHILRFDDILEEFEGKMDKNKEIDAKKIKRKPAKKR